MAGMNPRGPVHYFEEGEVPNEDRAPSGFWTSPRAVDALRRLDEWPEGVVLSKNIRKWAETDDVLDFGCGYGRLAQCFDASKYVGVDVSPAIIEEARRRNPKHSFEIITTGDLPQRKVAVASSVLQHIDDRKIVSVLGSSLGRAVESILVVECLGKKWRKGTEGDGLTFNRELKDYELGGWKATVLHQWPAAASPYPEVTAFLLRR